MSTSGTLFWFHAGLICGVVLAGRLIAEMLIKLLANVSGQAAAALLGKDLEFLVKLPGQQDAHRLLGASFHENHLAFILRDIPLKVNKGISLIA